MPEVEADGRLACRSAITGRTELAKAPSIQASGHQRIFDRSEEGRSHAIVAMRGSHWVIDSFLCVGNFASAGVTGTKKAREEKRLQLIGHGITHIVNCTREFECPFRNDFDYLHLQASDDTHQNMIQFWPSACSFIEEARQLGGRVLVHCAGGHSRSGSTAVAYLMKSNELTLEEALPMAQERRSSIAPNPGFLEQLKVWHRLGYIAPLRGEFRTPVTFPQGVMQQFPRNPPEGDRTQSGDKSVRVAIHINAVAEEVISKKVSSTIGLSEATALEDKDRQMIARTGTTNQEEVQIGAAVAKW
jgi:protein-tyrosine phosphatase